MNNLDIKRIASVQRRTHDLRTYVLVKNLSDTIVYNRPITFLSILGYKGTALQKHLEAYVSSGFTTIEKIKSDGLRVCQ